MRAEGISWQRRTLPGLCCLCGGAVPVGEPVLAGRRDDPAPGVDVCMSCVLTGVVGILPGRPSAPVACDLTDFEEGMWRYALADGRGTLGTASVDRDIDEDQQVPALFTLLCSELAKRAALAGLPGSRYSEAGDGWCFGGPPLDTWLVVWVRHQGGTEFWTPGLFIVPGEGADPMWHFTFEVKPKADLEVVAWRRAPSKPRVLDAGIAPSETSVGDIHDR